MTIKLLFWTLNILSILSIFFLMVFSIDCFEPEVPPRQALLCFLIHNIPAWILIVAFFVAQKSEMDGGVVFITLLMAMGMIFNSFTTNPTSQIVIFSFAVLWVLFIPHDYLSKKAKAQP